MKNSFLTIVLMLSSLANPIALEAQGKTDSLSLLIDPIFAVYTPATPGCAVTIVRNSTVVFKKGYGMANLEYSIPITPATVFDIASVSKQFAGFAIATLVQRGKVKLDEDIRMYLPEVPDFGRKITVRHLVHHTSGLRDWPEALHAAGWRWDDVFTFEDIIRMVRHQNDLDFDPGSSYSYSNTGYNLLALIVERVSGKSFRVWTDENIFTPLHMEASHFLDDRQKIIANLAYSYERSGSDFKKIPGSLTAYGSSSLFTTADDLAKWVIYFNQQIAAKNEVFLRMLEDGVLNNGEKVHYAFGLAIGEAGGLKTISHTGSWAGYRTIVANYPTENLSIIILCNISDFDRPGTAARIAAAILKSKFRAEAKQPEKETPLKPSPRVLSPAQLQPFNGIYHSAELETDYTITIADGKLMMHHMRLGDFELTPDAVTENLFASELGAIQFYQEKEKIAGYYLSGGRIRNIRFVKR